jgi:hypothetical protein
MSKLVPVTRLGRSAMDLRREASRFSDGAVVRRLLAIALVLEGLPRTEAAEACGMDRQTLRNWAYHYNEEGIDGLFNRRSPGRPAPRGTFNLASDRWFNLSRALLRSVTSLPRDPLVSSRMLSARRLISTLPISPRQRHNACGQPSSRRQWPSVPRPAADADAHQPVQNALQIIPQNRVPAIRRPTRFRPGLS